MCTQCVAQSSPMIAVGLAVLRRRALMSAVRNVLQRFPARSRQSVERPEGTRNPEYAG